MELRKKQLFSKTGTGSKFNTFGIKAISKCQNYKIKGGEFVQNTSMILSSI